MHKEETVDRVQYISSLRSVDVQDDLLRPIEEIQATLLEAEDTHEDKDDSLSEVDGTSGLVAAGEGERSQEGPPSKLLTHSSKHAVLLESPGSSDQESVPGAPVSDHESERAEHLLEEPRSSQEEVAEVPADLPLRLDPSSPGSPRESRQSPTEGNQPSGLQSLRSFVHSGAQRQSQPGDAESAVEQRDDQGSGYLEQEQQHSPRTVHHSDIKLELPPRSNVDEESYLNLPLSVPK